MRLTEVQPAILARLRPVDRVRDNELGGARRGERRVHREEVVLHDATFLEEHRGGGELTTLRAREE